MTCLFLRDEAPRARAQSCPLAPNQLNHIRNVDNAMAETGRLAELIHSSVRAIASAHHTSLQVRWLRQNQPHGKLASCVLAAPKSRMPSRACAWSANILFAAAPEREVLPLPSAGAAAAAGPAHTRAHSCPAVSWRGEPAGKPIRFGVAAMRDLLYSLLGPRTRMPARQSGKRHDG